MAGLSSLLMISVAVAGGAMAVCVKPVPTPVSGDEAAPCLAWAANGCASYQSCPGPDVCGPTGWFCGFNTCIVQGTINKPCHSVTAGVPAPITMCCVVGTVGPANGVFVAVPVMVGGGTCGWCEEVPPSEE